MEVEALNRGRIDFLEKVFEKVALQLWENDAKIHEEIGKIAAELLRNPPVLAKGESYKKGVVYSRSFLWTTIDQAIRDNSRM